MEFENVYVDDNKEFLHYFPLNTSIDLQYSIELNNSPTQNKTINFFQSKYPNNLEINHVIPIVKHYELCESIFKNIKPIEKNDFNNIADKVFLYIERCGFNINKSKLMEYYDIPFEMYNIQDKTIYTQYNLHTLTRRPSNHFNGINFAALNKENGCREAFIPSNNLFLEIDFSAYHPYLASRLIGYDFKQPIYKEFSEFSGLELKYAKEEMFRNINGNINPKYKNWEFFIKLQKYIDELWDEFNNNGLIIHPISKHVFQKDKLENMNPNKLFNYYIQHCETVNNVLIIWDIIKILKNKKTKIVYYLYDSILLDVDEDEEDSLIEIRDYLKNKQLEFKTKCGETYDFT